MVTLQLIQASNPYKLQLTLDKKKILFLRSPISLIANISLKYVCQWQKVLNPYEASIPPMHIFYVILWKIISDLNETKKK